MEQIIRLLESIDKKLGAIEQSNNRLYPEFPVNPYPLPYPYNNGNKQYPDINKIYCGGICKN